ncbi:efflux RND transporter periplasmic adaptor subunit [Pseudoxanthobacter sp. M-2]|uniref:efflux RND transporter periplasmic adaptor subunit n=1 Tax=Pseudoxanthobacter sp. M-2 TaxID=3078754 RepID=UPI0038FC498B
MTVRVSPICLLPASRRPSSARGLAGSLAAVLGAALLAASLSGGVGEALAAEAALDPAVGPQPPAVTVADVVAGTLTERVIVTGDLVPKEEILVTPEVEGLATIEILVEEGDRVAKNQVLARLSRDTVDVAIAQADAQIARARASIAQARTQIVQANATLKQAQNSFERAERLRKTGTASIETYETREAEALVAQAQVAAAEEQLALAEADLALAEAQKREQMVGLGRTEIKAPTAGIVSRREARLGAVVSMAGTPMFRIIEDGEVELEADIAEMTLAKLRVGQKATVFPAGYSEGLPGEVRLISPEVDNATRLGEIRVSLQEAEGLAIGAFAYASIETATREGVIIPLSAVLYGTGGRAQVQLVEDAVVVSRPVTIGLHADGLALVTDGLKAGDQVVSISGTFLRPGDRITPIVAKN